jgi:hypothetical protein
MTIFTEYKPRQIKFVELWTFEDWKIKIYCIYESENLWNDGYIDIAKSLAETEIKKLSGESSNHKTGFLTIHIASMFNQIIFDWWAHQNELRHIVFKANADTLESFRNITSSGEAFCIWELNVIAHERESWIRNILENYPNPNFESYYADRLNGMA